MTSFRKYVTTFVSAFLLTSTPIVACERYFALEMLEDPTFLVDENIRLNSAQKRTYYSRALTNEIDRLFKLEDDKFAKSGNRFSRVYRLAAIDPTNFQVYLHDESARSRIRYLRRMLFGTDTEAADRPRVSRFLTRNLVSKLQEDGLEASSTMQLISDFPGYAIETAPTNLLTELWALEYAGDFLQLEKVSTLVNFQLLSNKGVVVSANTIFPDGKIERSKFGSLLDALEHSQVHPDEPCGMEITLERVWMDSDFLFKYARKRSTDTIFSDKKLDPWKRHKLSGFGPLDIQNIFETEYYVNSIYLSFGDEFATLVGYGLRPLRLQ